MIIPYSSRNTRLFFFHYHHYRSSSTTSTGTATSITMRRFHNYFANSSSSALLSYTTASSKSSVVLIDDQMFYKNANSYNTTVGQFANFSTGKSIPKSSISSTTTTIRPFKILGLQQVAVGSTDTSSLKRLWLDVLGLEKIGEYSSQQENVIEDILKLGNDSSSSSKKGPSVSVEIDLMCPIDENRSPKVHQPPLNHIGLWVDNLETAVEWMTSKGVRFTPGGIRKGAAGHNVTFIHPKGNEEFPIGGCGVLIELVQAPKDVIDKLA